MVANRQIHLVETPKGKLGPEHFHLAEATVPAPKAGEVLLKVLYVGLDAANRAWMQGATYRNAVEAGTVMAGGALAEVIESKASGFAVGDVVFADTGWQEYAALPAEALTKLARVEPLTHLLSLYAVSGPTAYFGLLKVARAVAGETVVVSAAAGSVGSLVGQIAKIKGCHVVGIAGGAEKCRWLVDELGFDGAVDYKAGDFHKQLKAATPKGIDVYFDNVGGDVLEAVLFRMNMKGRIACCGAVSQYDTATPRGVRGVPGLLVVKRLRMEGFIVMDFQADAAVAAADLKSWVAAGKLKVQEDVLVGLEHLPQALIGLLSGENRGKRIVKVA
ncbi:NADP-dependent oxidoreductase [Chelatococcus reniformis]|uniref:NADP-dependent oxidoreductase n=1 Tax=Chelatococcus reniformis TaxID=1494448 RepID=A0A916XAE9_9HYPH|nr:NADP-dependent oxidoreductase [Chelatococcus reniformis]GGC57073.1 NADP-dependent oxidoreductase [Chelatococcus reniformis]